MLDFSDISNQLKKFNFKISSDFWELVKGNIENLEELELWWNIIYGNIEPKYNDENFLNTALETLPEGMKGKELYNPLRMCLTGQNKGPEMATLVLLMGRGKVLERLTNK